MAQAFVRDYEIYCTDSAPEDPIYLIAYPSKDKVYYEPLPTPEECNEILGTSGRYLQIGLGSCVNMLASPALPDVVETCDLSDCSSLLIAPKLPKTLHAGKINGCFYGCYSLAYPAVIPKATINPQAIYMHCTSLMCAASIPENVTNLTNVYNDCTNLTGEFCIRPTSVTYHSNTLKDTTKPIIIYGDQALCEAVAATANNGNASWQPWYEPVPAVTDRGQGSYTTADDMTRMVRNGVLSVDTYAPGRMVYHQGDIVREDEWEALVEAAQTIDPTVTMSTHYTNLNKIEKAFDDAL